MHHIPQILSTYQYSAEWDSWELEKWLRMYLVDTGENSETGK